MKFCYIYFSILITMLGSCTSGIPPTLQTGDLLFCSYKTGNISSAINAVTSTDSIHAFTHVALVVRNNSGNFDIIHASPRKGVIKESLKQFVDEEHASRIAIYRLRKEYQESIIQAVDSAKKLVGLPYNFSFVMNDTSYYCSQFIYAIFDKDQPFELCPMTFKDSPGAEFNTEWIQYFDSIGMEIPEGFGGCNPNGMSQSDHLFFIGELL